MIRGVLTGGARGAPHPGVKAWVRQKILKRFFVFNYYYYSVFPKNKKKYENGDDRRSPLFKKLDLSAAIIVALML